MRSGPGASRLRRWKVPSRIRTSSRSASSVRSSPRTRSAIRRTGAEPLSRSIPAILSSTPSAARISRLVLRERRSARSSRRTTPMAADTGSPRGRSRVRAVRLTSSPTCSSMTRQTRSVAVGRGPDERRWVRMLRARCVLSETRASGNPARSPYGQGMSIPVHRSPNTQSISENGLVPLTTTAYRARSRSLTTYITF